MKKVAWLALIAIVFSSCVSSKVHQDVQSKYEDCQDELNAQRRAREEAETELTELRARQKRQEEKLATLETDTTKKAQRISRLERNYADLNKSYEFLLNNNNSLLANNARENKALLTRLEDLQDRLQEKEDSLHEESVRLEKMTADLKARSKRVDELESAIATKDSVVDYIRKKVSDALLGFQGKGLTIETKNGRVYVSLENSLLFPSGSWEVTDKGKNALDELARVLASNKDINVLVEGHTDNDRYRGNGTVKDNWDLSVLRATSVTRILQDGGLSPEQVTAAGRGEYMPLVENSNAENKAINRRTEVILTPKWEELLEIIE